MCAARLVWGDFQFFEKLFKKACRAKITPQKIKPTHQQLANNNQHPININVKYPDTFSGYLLLHSIL